MIGKNIFNIIMIGGCVYIGTPSCVVVCGEKLESEVCETDAMKFPADRLSELTFNITDKVEIEKGISDLVKDLWSKDPTILGDDLDQSHIADYYRHLRLMRLRRQKGLDTTSFDEAMANIHMYVYSTEDEKDTYTGYKARLLLDDLHWYMKNINSLRILPSNDLFRYYVLLAVKALLPNRDNLDHGKDPLYDALALLENSIEDVKARDHWGDENKIIYQHELYFLRHLLRLRSYGPDIAKAYDAPHQLDLLRLESLRAMYNLKQNNENVSVIKAEKINEYISHIIRCIYKWYSDFTKFYYEDTRDYDEFLHQLEQHIADMKRLIDEGVSKAKELRQEVSRFLS